MFQIRESGIGISDNQHRVQQLILKTLPNQSYQTKYIAGGSTVALIADDAWDIGTDRLC